MRRLLLAALLLALGIAPAAALGGLRPRASIAVPAAAAANGFTTLGFNQDALTGFDLSPDGTGAHRWFNGFWQGGTPTPSASISWTAAGQIKLIWDSSFLGTCNANLSSVCYLPAVSTAGNPATLAGARGFGHGYYDWVFAFAPNADGAWPAGWILGLQTGRDCKAQGYGNYPDNHVANPVAYSEIDTVETFPPNLTENYHYSNAKADCGDSPDQNFSNAFSYAGGTAAHKYGLLWTSGQVCYYYDDTQEFCHATGAASEGQLHTIQVWMGELCTKANDGSCLGGVTEFDLLVTSVRYWSCATWQQDALAC